MRALVASLLAVVLLGATVGATGSSAEAAVRTVTPDAARIAADSVLGVAGGLLKGTGGIIVGVGGKALGVVSKACTLIGDTPTVAGKVCKGVKAAGGVLSGLRGLSGLLGGGSGGGIAKTIAKTAATTAILVGLALLAARAAKSALNELARVIGATTSPQVQAAWFSGPYWRVAALSFLLTLPFLFAAAIQALARSDLALLARAAFGYLPLSILAICIAQPLTALLLSTSDAMSSTVNAAGSGGDLRFLAVLAAAAGGLSGLPGSAFLGLLIAFIVIGAAIALTLELLAREAAIYIVLLMLPLTFAAMVWPARRIWAVKTVEVLVALILSKFVIVAILTLSESAFGHVSGGGVGTLMAGMTLLILAAFSPWVLLRLIPFSEVAAGIGGALQNERTRLTNYAGMANTFDIQRAEARGLGTEPYGDDAPTTPEPQLPPDDEGTRAGGLLGGGPGGGRPPGLPAGHGPDGGRDDRPDGLGGPGGLGGPSGLGGPGGLGGSGGLDRPGAGGSHGGGSAGEGSSAADGPGLAGHDPGPGALEPPIAPGNLQTFPASVAADVPAASAAPSEGGPGTAAADAGGSPDAGAAPLGAAKAEVMEALRQYTGAAGAEFVLGPREPAPPRDLTSSGHPVVEPPSNGRSGGTPAAPVDAPRSAGGSEDVDPLPAAQPPEDGVL